MGASVLGSPPIITRILERQISNFQKVQNPSCVDSLSSGITLSRFTYSASRPCIDRFSIHFQQLQWERSNQFGESPKGLILAFYSSVLSSEGKDLIGGEKEQSAYHRIVPRSCTMSPNDPNMTMLKDRARHR
uniref:Uncharacterized protein n=1 Tax=Solanum tuberosum TaxID=4113 RepID=M1DUA6_SOLTU